MDLIFEILGAMASVATVLQVTLELVERYKRRRMGRKEQIEPGGHPALKYPYRAARFSNGLTLLGVGLCW